MEAQILPYASVLVLTEGAPTAVLARATNVVRLSLTIPITYALPSLPHLERLHIDLKGHQLMPTLRHALNATPRLNHLVLSCYQACPPDLAVTLLTASLRRYLRVQVRFIEVTERNCLDELQELARLCGWLALYVVYEAQ